MQSKDQILFIFSSAFTLHSLLFADQYPILSGTSWMNQFLIAMGRSMIILNFHIEALRPNMKDALNCNFPAPPLTVKVCRFLEVACWSRTCPRVGGQVMYVKSTKLNMTEGGCNVLVGLFMVSRTKVVNWRGQVNRLLFGRLPSKTSSLSLHHGKWNRKPSM